MSKSKREVLNRELMKHEAKLRNNGKDDRWRRGEESMTNHFLDRFHDEAFPYLYKYEWEYIKGFSNLGAGDLVFSSDRYSDESTSYLVVEVKYLTEETGKTARTKRNKAKAKCEQQLENSIAAFAKQKTSSKNVFGATLMINEKICILTYKN
jgi:hypothetical protein